MVSHNSFRLFGYLYVGLCLSSSMLLLINGSQLIKDDGDSYIVGLTVLLYSVISIIFDLCLAAGIVVRRIKYVEYYVKFVTFIYTIMLLGLFIGCIVVGILLAPQARRYIEISAVIIAVTQLFVWAILIISIFFALTVWLLNGVMDFIKYEMVRFVPSEGGALG